MITRPVCKPVRFLFVDNVRFWSMFAIVAMHSVAIFYVLGNPRPGVHRLLVTPFKFGTIAFFLIAGFLAGRGIQTRHPAHYLQRRLQRIGLPWLLWFCIHTLALLGTDLSHHRLPLHSASGMLALLGTRTTETLFDSAYWFVPNLLISLSILLLCRRFLDSPRFGMVLLTVNLVYGANVYTGWFPVANAMAVFGFVLYLWLGVLAAWHQQTFDRWIARISLPVLGGAFVVSGLLAYAESGLLIHLHAADPLSALRVTNQLFSVVAVLFLYKFKGPISPRLVNVRDNSFGIYLTHGIVLLALFVPFKERHLHAFSAGLLRTRPGSCVLWLGVTLVAYGISVGITKLLVSQPALRWMVGVETPHLNAADAERSSQAREPVTA